jgi:hypothetical protein
MLLLSVEDFFLYFFIPLSIVDALGRAHFEQLYSYFGIEHSY